MADVDMNQKAVAVISVGRCNPPTRGHLKVFEKVVNTAKEFDGDPIIFITHSQDNKRNPLPWEIKIEYLKDIVGDQVVFCEDSAVLTAMDFLVWISGKGYKKVIWICGSDRVLDFNEFAQKYNGKETPRGKYDFEVIKVVSAGERDPDAEDVAGFSATKARNAALDGDFETFKKIVAVNSPQRASAMFNTIRKFMGLGENVLNTGLSINRRELTQFFKNLPESVVWNIIEGVESTFDEGVEDYQKSMSSESPLGKNLDVLSTEMAPLEKQRFDHYDQEFENPFVVNTKYDATGQAYVEKRTLQESEIEIRYWVHVLRDEDAIGNVDRSSPENTFNNSSIYSYMVDRDPTLDKQEAKELFLAAWKAAGFPVKKSQTSAGECPECGSTDTEMQTDSQGSYFTCRDCGYIGDGLNESKKRGLKEYVVHVAGHKNSSGKDAPWVIKSHKDDHIISSHASKAAAEKHLQQMHIYGEDLARLIYDVGQREQGGILVPIKGEKA